MSVPIEQARRAIHHHLRREFYARPVTALPPARHPAGARGLICLDLMDPDDDLVGEVILGTMPAEWRTMSGTYRPFGEWLTVAFRPTVAAGLGITPNPDTHAVHAFYARMAR